MSKRNDFIQTYGPVAVAACKGSGIFPETALAQAVNETGDSLIKADNNFFNINAGGVWKGKTTPTKKDWKMVKGVKTYYEIKFRAYDSPEAAFKGYIEFLKTNPRYTKAGVFAAKTYREQIEAIAKAGYAASPTYAKTTISVANAIAKKLGTFADEVIDAAKNNSGTLIIVLLLCLVAVALTI